MAGCALLLTAVLSAQASPGSGYELVHAARWYVDVERWDDAIQAALDFEAKYPASPRVGDARYLRHKAQLFKLLERTTDDPPLRSAAQLIRDLEALSQEPSDDAVAAAKLALGTVYYLATSRRQPEAFVAEALRDWRALDRARPSPRLRPHHEYDVIEIRNLLFQPHGGGIFAGDHRWSDFKWAPRSTPYLLVNPAIRVLLGERERAYVVAYDPFPGLPNVIFMGDERRALLDRIILRLGTAKKRSWMKPGKRLDVLTLWMRASFGARGTMDGWLFENHPRISSIAFLDPQRTRAVVQLVIGYAGGSVWMEKREGRWVAVGLRDFWTADGVTSFR